MVYVSTDYVFNRSKGLPFLETGLPNPTNPFAQTKLARGWASQKGSGRWMIVRTTWFFREWRQGFIPNVLKWSKMRPELNLVNDKVGSPSYSLGLSQAFHSLKI